MPIQLLKSQFLAVIAGALIAGLVGGARAAMSVALGGASCVIPNALFALRLALSARHPGGATPGGFFAGELLKVGSTVLLLFGAACGVRELSWPWFIAGIVVALKSYFLILLWRGRATTRS